MNERDKELDGAREAFIARGLWPNEVMWACYKDAWLTGAEIEREACAKVCLDWMEPFSGFNDYCKGGIDGLTKASKAIRARGNT